MAIAKMVLGQGAGCRPARAFRRFPHSQRHAGGGASTWARMSIASREMLQQFGLMGEIYSRLRAEDQAAARGPAFDRRRRAQGQCAHARSHAAAEDRWGSISSATWKAAIFSRARADVIVCDGFVGNVALKVSEGLVGDDPQHAARIARGHALPARSAMRSRVRRTRISRSESIIPSTAARRCWASRASASSATAGRTRNAIKNAIRVAADFASSNMNQRIEEELREFAKAG